ncbi:hypothetical protein [Mycobacteroides abscessus]|uniref:hypothetical protein n=1 Tax=Mycobacteroides abscessus TaxID=36809 RepID=UPI001877B9D9|nr:hypothetical protein [Mycobacteroides abscessus]MBN7311018.1 hypothetical protein [Mycobacteroides abscessus subsp. abscessus]
MRYLDRWRRHVTSTEKRVRQAGHISTGFCAMCDGLILDDARDRLESLMGHGGRRAHRLRVAVNALDERFRNVTVEYDTWQSLPWWHRRRPRC